MYMNLDTGNWIDAIVLAMQGNTSSGNETWLDYVGMYNPFISAAITVAYLWKRKPYWISYLVLNGLNEELSIGLKRLIREPRPTPYVEDPHHRGYYGMPSGHTQNAAFTLVYVALVQPSWMMSCLLVLLGMITVVERYKHGRHTIKQMAVGGAIGGVFAVASVYLVRRMLEWNLFPSILM
jgi:membrane-associated phospholipid phosphatase